MRTRYRHSCFFWGAVHLPASRASFSLSLSSQISVRWSSICVACSLLDDAGVSLCQLGPDAWQQFISDEVGKLLRLRLFAAHEQPVDSRLREPRGHLLVVRLVLLSESLMLQVLGEASPTSTSFREHLRVMPSSLVLATRFLTAWASFPAFYCKVLHATSADINRLPFLSQYRVIASFMKPVRVAPCWNREMSKTASMS
jgi:hypothetical protein